MSTDHISVQFSELLHRGGKGHWVYGVKCTWLVTQMGFGEGVLTWAYYRAASKSALFLDLFAKAGFPVLK